MTNLWKLACVQNNMEDFQHVLLMFICVSCSVKYKIHYFRLGFLMKCKADVLYPLLILTSRALKLVADSPEVADGGTVSRYAR
jgi:hypothetical protein